MTNHELCLSAAKAAGYTVESDYEGCFKRTTPDGLTTSWNPLEYSVDAFELVVDCGIEVVPTARRVTAIAPSKNGLLVESEDASTDKHAATRRAIVRAAAAMGADNANL